MKNYLRYAAIRAVAWLDDKILQHRCYESVCRRFALHPWHKALCGGGCRDRDEDGFCRRCGWREEVDRG